MPSFFKKQSSNRKRTDAPTVVEAATMDIDMENNISENRLLVRKMIAAKSFGIIPRTKFSINHELLGGVLTIKQITCDVLLPAGQVAVVETKAPITLTIPDKETNELYLTLEVGDHLVTFQKDGVPHVVNEYKFDFKALQDVKVLLMTYSNMKPLDPEAHRQLAAWVREGGRLIYCGRDNDPFQSVQEWWNTAGNAYAAPSDHLFSLMGIPSCSERSSVITPMPACVP